MHGPMNIKTAELIQSLETDNSNLHVLFFSDHHRE